MLRRLGYVGISLSIAASSNSGTILRNATPERLRALIGANIEGLRQILAFNAEQRVLMFRISSQIIPFGGHPVNDLAWWEEFAAPLAEAGAFIREQGMRVSMHPGQYTLLSSPDAEVTAATFRDLAWQARLLDALGVDRGHKLVTHGGGAYGDKAAALARWAERYAALPERIRRRLVVENDERIFTVEDLLGLSERTGVPVVLDTLHHAINPGTGKYSLHDLLRACFRTWRPEDGPPKVHVSSQSAEKKVGAHAEYVETADFLAFLEQAPAQPFDCMLEAKTKDLALFRLRAALAQRGIFERDLVTSAR